MPPATRYFPPNTPLHVTEKWVADNLEGEGCICPNCHLLAARRHRQMTSYTGQTMVAMYRYHRGDYVHIPTLVKTYLPTNQGGYAVLGQHWGLVAEGEGRREDGGHAGHWILTFEGELFVQGLLEVRRKVVLYGNKVEWFEGKMVDIHAVLGTKFNLQELLYG